MLFSSAALQWYTQPKYIVGFTEQLVTMGAEDIKVSIVTTCHFQRIDTPNYADRRHLAAATLFGTNYLTSYI